MTPPPPTPTPGSRSDKPAQTGQPGPANQAEVAARVGRELHTAAAGSGLRVVEYPELAGASVVSAYSEAYVIATIGGYQVDVWRHAGFDPFRIEQVAELSEAVVVAIEAVLHRTQRRPGHAHHPTNGPPPSSRTSIA